MDTTKKLLEVIDLKTHFTTIEGVAKAVDGASFDLVPGETLGIVGESGCGKSVTALSVLGLLPKPAGKVVSGQILFKGTDIAHLDNVSMERLRGDRISMIFQEPMTSLNPLFTVGDQISEMFTCHRDMGKKEALDCAVEMLDRVQIPAPAKRAKDYPHQMSGGMRQRVMIAMALSCNPEILIADEPTTALDVTIQAQVLDLMLELKEASNASVMMITHDLGVVAQVAQKVLVMYAGKIFETGDVFTLFENPKHPYTQALLQSVPRLGRRIERGRERLEEIEGMVPSLYNLPPGCSYYGRCKQSTPACSTTEISLNTLDPGISVRCLLYQ